MMFRRGMTLVELLLATVISSMVIITSISWSARVTRLAKLQAQKALVSASRSAVVALLADDLAMGIPDEKGIRWRGTEQALYVRTLHAPPGDPIGDHEVMWTWDDTSRTVLRSTGGNSRFVSRQCGEVTFRITSTEVRCDSRTVRIVSAYG